MSLPFAGQKALAKQNFRTFQRTAFFKFIGVYDKKIANMIGMI